MKANHPEQEDGDKRFHSVREALRELDRIVERLDPIYIHEEIPSGQMLQILLLDKEIERLCEFAILARLSHMNGVSR